MFPNCIDRNGPNVNLKGKKNANFTPNLLSLRTFPSSNVLKVIILIEHCVTTLDGWTSP